MIQTLTIYVAILEPIRFSGMIEMGKENTLSLWDIFIKIVGPNILVLGLMLEFKDCPHRGIRYSTNHIHDPLQSNNKRKENSVNTL